MRYQEGHRDQAGHPRPQAIPWFCCLPGIPLWLPLPGIILETKVIQICCGPMASEWMLVGKLSWSPWQGRSWDLVGGLHSTGTQFPSGPGRTFE